jgi:hypothetical protein
LTTLASFCSDTTHHTTAPHSSHSSASIHTLNTPFTIQPTCNMASWETDGGAAAASAAESNEFGEAPADTKAEGNAFDMAAISGVLSDAEKAAHRDRARDAGWVETVPVDYKVQQSSRDDDHANYLKNSAVYEWDDEYGDVGPEVPELEQDLFGGDFRVRQGQHMDKLQFEVTVEGPDRLQPARSVSFLAYPPSILQAADRVAVRYCWPSPYPPGNCNQEDGLLGAHAYPGLHDPCGPLWCRCHWNFSDRSVMLPSCALSFTS